MHVIYVHVELYRFLRVSHLRVINLNTYLMKRVSPTKILSLNSPVWNRMLWYVRVKCAFIGGDSGQIHRNVSCKFKTLHVISFYDNVDWYIIIVNVTDFYAVGVTEKRYPEWFLSQRRDVSCASAA